MQPATLDQPEIQPVVLEPEAVDRMPGDVADDACGDVDLSQATTLA
jgi:hypothetical protein